MTGTTAEAVADLCDGAPVGAAMGAPLNPTVAPTAVFES